MRTTPQFIRFPGGKAKLAATGIIGRRLGDITGELRVPFAGSLGDGLDLLRNGHLGPHAKVWINDINPNIANMWQVILGQPEDLCDRVREVVPSKLLFHEWKRSLLDASVSLDPVERAVRVVGVHRMSHSGRGTKGGALGNIGSRWNAARVCEGIEEAHGLLKGRTRVSCQDFGALLEAPGRDVALYLDPPYVVAGDGLYEFPFKPEDHRRLAAALATTPHRWLLSYDDHPVVRDGLRFSIERSGGDLTVVGEASDGRELLDLAAALHPDVYVVDVTMPVLNGLAATRELVRRDPSAKVILLSVHDSSAVVQGALLAGARGFLTKQTATRYVVEAIREVHAGRYFLSPVVAGILVAPFLENARQVEARPAASSLTGQERRVLQLVAEGRSTKEIAGILDVAVNTVHTHRNHLMAKLDLHNQAALVRYALKEGIARP